MHISGTIIGLLVCSSMVSACQQGGSGGSGNTTNANESASPTTMPAKPFLTIEPKVLDAHRVQLTIGTNLPMPIQVATSIDLHGQKDTDTYIGYGKFIALTGASTVIVLDTSKADKPLPAANYDATVDFFPK